MNYFPLDPDPWLSAIALDDKRLRRIYMEAVMILSEVQRIRHPRKPNPYERKMPMPPALMTWIAAAEDNRLWFNHWAACLQCALVMRFGSDRIMQYAASRKHAQLIEAEYFPSQTPPKHFVNLAKSVEKGLDYTQVQDTHKAYRDYVAYQWDHVDKVKPKWSAPHSRPSTY